MKILSIKPVILTMFLRSLSLQSSSPTTTMAMTMKNMLMGDSLDSYLSDLVSFGDISSNQKKHIIRIGKSNLPADHFSGGGLFSSVDKSGNDDDRTSVFSSVRSKQELIAYLHAEVSAGKMVFQAAEDISSMLSLGAMYPTAALEEALAMANGPAEAGYTGEGNMVRVGNSNLRVSSSVSFYNGIWGYATGNREYALQCHGQGFSIIDVTDPAKPFRVQFVAMEGGGFWRDVATHYDSNTKKTYAYVGAQGTQGGGKNPNLFVFDLSHLSGEINNAHGVDTNPIPSGPSGYLNLGETGYTHTLNVGRGLLFLNTASSSFGCRVYDLTADPMKPKYLFNTAGSGKSCHDSSVVEDVGGRDLLIVSDGSGRCQRIYDITSVSASTTKVPPLIGQTSQISGIYAHSNWISEDKRYLFSWDENNVIDISVHDLVDPGSPKQIALFQYSDNAKNNAIPHNGQVKGKYLYVAYYEAGLRVFDVSNPFAILEIGKVETYRDPDGDGKFTNSILRDWEGAWNTYPFLPSGNILVSDMYAGLFIVQANPPYSAPADPSVTAQRDASDNVVLNWIADENARGYSVERSSSLGGSYTAIVEHLTSTSFVDSSVRGKAAFYKVRAVNGEGVGISSIVEVLPNPTPSPTSPIPTKAPTPMPTPSPAIFICVKSNVVCPQNPQNCCSGSCRKGKCR